MGEIASCKEAKGVSGEKIKKIEREQFPWGWCLLVEFREICTTEQRDGFLDNTNPGD